MTEPSVELARPAELVDVRSGEVLPATPENAAELLIAVRDLRSCMLGLVRDCEAVLLDESRKLGTKTLHLPAGKATISGGAELAWDVSTLARLLALGLPDERYNELVKTTVSYKVNAAVAHQLEAANADYAAVIDEARSYEEKPWRVSIR